MVEIRVVRDTTGEPVLPIYLDDNYITLLPKETRKISGLFATEDLGGETARRQDQGLEREISGYYFLRDSRRARIFSWFGLSSRDFVQVLTASALFPSWK